MSKGTKLIRFGTVNRKLDMARIIMQEHDNMVEKMGEHTKEGQYHKGVSDGLNVIVSELEKLGE